MTEEIIAKITQYVYSDDIELRRFGRRLFWSNNPTFEDAKKVEKEGYGNISEERFNELKQLFKTEDEKVCDDPV